VDDGSIREDDAQYILGVNDVAVIDWMERCNSFNSVYFKEHVLMPFREKFGHGALNRGYSRTIIHMDNASPYFSKANRDFTDKNGF
jgi:hypothetical protein